MPTKAELRQVLLAKRSKISAEQRLQASQRVCDKLRQLSIWRANQCIHSYTPYTPWQELDIRGALAQLQRDCLVSVDVAPAAAIGTMPSRQYDVIIVPTVGFTSSLYRIGMGKGWYDQFLATQPGAITIGISYDWACTSFTPNSHDYRLDMIVTDRTIYTR